MKKILKTSFEKSRKIKADEKKKVKRIKDNKRATAKKNRNLNQFSKMRLALKKNLTKLQILGIDRDLKFPQYHCAVPTNLCLITAPDETLEFLEDLKNALSAGNERNIFVSHVATENVELSASHLFDETIQQHREHLRKAGVYLSIGGQTSVKKAVNNFLIAAGFLKVMKISLSQISDAFDSAYKDKFKIFSYKGSKKSPHAKGVVGGELINYFDTCFNTFNLAITGPGKEHLSAAIGEIVGNAEEHTGLENEWKVLGCFNKDTRTVSFSIINTGQTIFETLSDKTSTAKKVLELVEKVILSHKSVAQKIGNIFMPVSSVEPIWNVMALQEGISSKRTDTGEGSTRGQGLMDVIDFVGQLKAGQDGGTIVIISGHSYCLIDSTYLMQTIEINGEKRRKLCFNATSDLHMPQDPDKIRYLKNKFQGTIITGTFKISDSYVTNRP